MPKVYLFVTNFKLSKCLADIIKEELSDSEYIYYIHFLKKKFFLIISISRIVPDNVIDNIIRFNYQQ